MVSQTPTAVLNMCFTRSVKARRKHFHFLPLKWRCVNASCILPCLFGVADAPAGFQLQAMTPVMDSMHHTISALQLSKLVQLRLHMLHAGSMASMTSGYPFHLETSTAVVSAEVRRTVTVHGDGIRVLVGTFPQTCFAQEGWDIRSSCERRIFSLTSSWIVLEWTRSGYCEVADHPVASSMHNWSAEVAQPCAHKELTDFADVPLLSCRMECVQQSGLGSDGPLRRCKLDGERACAYSLQAGIGQRSLSGVLVFVVGAMAVDKDFARTIWVPSAE